MASEQVAIEGVSGEIHTIYVLIDPRTTEVRYLGRTRGSLPSRLALHCRSGCGRRRHAWVNNLAAVGLRPRIVPIEMFDSAEHAADAEHDWYLRLVSLGAQLTNALEPKSSLSRWLHERASA